MTPLSSRFEIVKAEVWPGNQLIPGTPGEEPPCWNRGLVLLLRASGAWVVESKRLQDLTVAQVRERVIFLPPDENQHTERNHLRLRRHAGRHDAAALARLAGDHATTWTAFSRRPVLRARRRADARHSQNVEPGTGRAARSGCRGARKGARVSAADRAGRAGQR